MLDVLHEAQLREHGGSPGVRDHGLLAAALPRPRQKFVYARGPDLATRAAAYAFGLTKNHGYVDGNKRAAFASIIVFLGLNEIDFDVPPQDASAIILSLAAGEVSEDGLTRWIRDNWPSE